MKTWFLIGPDRRYALSKRPDGKGLPALEWPWSLSHRVDLDRCSLDDLQAVRSIEVKGFYLIDPAAPELARYKALMAGTAAGPQTAAPALGHAPPELGKSQMRDLIWNSIDMLRGLAPPRANGGLRSQPK